jgi:rRNA maturation endonuclease Nob1
LMAPVKASTAVKYAKFCHNCGSKYPLSEAKFCCVCGVQRLAV